jgi:hypothetical protein
MDDAYLIGEEVLHGMTSNLGMVERGHIRLVSQHFEGKMIVDGLAEGISGIRRGS